MLTKKETIKELSKNDIKAPKSPKSAPAAYPPSSETCCSAPTPTSLAAHTSFSPSEKKPGQKTRVIVKFDTGFSNQLYIRGKGANLSWDKGIPLKNVKADEWVWETDAPFTTCEFKVLINDKYYETGENHPLHAGANVLYTPRF